MQLNVNETRIIEDPTEDELRSEIANLGEDEFLILSLDEEVYIQVYHNEDGTYQLEYRDGSEDQHFGVDPETIGVADVTSALLLYLNDPQSIVEKWDWELLELDLSESDESDVEYNGVMMAAGWPERIETAQLIETIDIGGTEYHRIRFGDETHMETKGHRLCGDCGVLAEQFHVPGCDIEQCPCCKGQLFSCDCEVEEED